MNNIHEVIVVSHQTAKLIVENMQRKESPCKKAFIRECLETSIQINRNEIARKFA